MGWLIEIIVRPLGQRLGTLVGSYLTAEGLAADDINIVLAAIPVVVGVIADLIQRRLY